MGEVLTVMQKLAQTPYKYLSVGEQIDKQLLGEKAIRAIKRLAGVPLSDCMGGLMVAPCELYWSPAGSEPRPPYKYAPN
jgi:hypothetical protein